jgi:CHAT domain-containing protein
MMGARFIPIVIALLAAARLCYGQTATKDAIEERIRHADVLQDKGALSESRNIYESLLTALPSEPPTRQLGHVLNGLANLLSSLGEHRHAIEFAERANQVYRRLGDADGEAYALNNRGIAEGELGDYPAAQVTLRQALVFGQQAGDFETQIRTLNNLGNAYYFPGQYLESLRAYQNAWRILDDHPADKSNDYWRQITRFNEATLYQRLGRYQSALEIYKQVERSKGLSASDRGHLLTNLGALYRRLGDSWKALDAYRSAVSLYSQQSDSVGEISALKNIGIVYALDQSDLAKAHKYFEMALARARQTHNQREEMQAHLYLGETKLRELKMRDCRAEFQLAVEQARKLGTTEEQWKALYGMGRAEGHLGNLRQAEVDYREAIAIIERSRAQLQLSALRAEFLADKRDAYDALITLLLNKKDVKEAFLFLERSRARTFQDRLASVSAGQATPVAVSLDEVRGRLDPSTILMEFWVAGDRLALLWCTRDSFGVGQTQVPAAERQQILAFLRLLPGNLAQDWRSQTKLLAPLIPEGVSLPSAVTHALIVPDGWVSSVPFDLIPIDKSDRMLIERVDLSYLPTAALLRRPPLNQPRAYFPWARELVAFGNPQPPKRPLDSASFEGEAAFEPLPYSAKEISSISQMVRGRANVFLGVTNLKSTFLANKIRGVPILHMSTHAIADADVPENSRILFSPEPSSGIPNYLFLRELYEMDLRDVSLTTFAACDTERGRMMRGEGVQAFGRALLYAGSRSALTTQWRVADQPTSEFMKQFYYYALAKHQSKAEALRSAKLKFLRSRTDFASPAYWAGFVLAGDGLSQLPRFFSWSELALVVLLAAVVLTAGIWFLLRLRGRINRVHRS